MMEVNVLHLSNMFQLILAINRAGEGKGKEIELGVLLNVLEFVVFQPKSRVVT